MFEIREEKTYIYFDENIKDFSNLAAGLLTRGLGQGVRIAYVDSSNTAKKLTNFIENFSLNYSFVKNLNINTMGIFSPKNEMIVTKTLLPQVEYLNMTRDMFWKDLINYDLIILDNLTLKEFKKIKIISLLKNKNLKTQIIAITKEKNTFEELKDEFNHSIKCKYKKSNSLTKVKGITSVFGNANGKSTFAYGELLRGFLYKADVKLIYFNKAEDFYGDVTFFKHFKKWQKENSFYGSFDYVQTGVKPQNKDINLKKEEANQALMLLKTALKKQSPVVADEILNIINEEIIDINEIIKILSETKNQIILTGNEIERNIENLSENLVEIVENKK